MNRRTFEAIERRAYATGIRIDHDADKTFSGLKVVRIIIKAWDERQARSQGRGDVYNSPDATWLVRRADRNTWINFVFNNTSDIWMVVESAPFVATAAMLPSTALKQQLDADGCVAIQVNFLPPTRPRSCRSRSGRSNRCWRC